MLSSDIIRRYIPGWNFCYLSKKEKQVFHALEEDVHPGIYEEIKDFYDNDEGYKDLFSDKVLLKHVLTTAPLLFSPLYEPLRKFIVSDKLRILPSVIAVCLVFYYNECTATKEAKLENLLSEYAEKIPTIDEIRKQYKI